MSILNVNQIQPVGGGNTITVSASDVNFSGNISIGSSFVGTASTATLAIISQGLTGIPDITVNNIQSGVVTATTFIGDGSGITGVTASGSGIGIKDSASTVGVAATVDFGTNLNVSPAFAGIVTVTVGDTDFEIVDKIVHTGDTDTAIRFPATDTISAETSGVERLRITSTGKLEAYKGTSTTGKTSGSEALTVGNGAGSHRFAVYPDGTTVIGGTGDIGNYNILLQNDGKAVFDSDVGIGTDNPESALHIVGTIPSAPTKFGVHIGAHSGYGVMQFSAATGGIIDFGESGVDSAGRIIYTHSDDTLKLQTANSEKLRITSDGKVGIGEDSPDGLLVIKGDSNGASNPSIRLKDGTDTREAWITNASGDLILANGGDDNTPHCKITMFDANILSFETSNVEALRIDSGGKLLLKKAQQFQYNTGNANSRTWYLNNDIHVYGDFAFRRSTTQSGATFETKILFKESGGICFNGDTAAANALDDYEEGYWTPTIYGGGNPSSTIAVRRARYTKVGRKVTICGEILFTGGDGGMFTLAGLPYFLDTTGTAPSGQSGAGMSAVGNVLFSNLNITGVSCLTAYLWSNLIYFYYTPSGDGATWAAMTGNQIGGNSGGADLIFTVTYFTST